MSATLFSLVITLRASEEWEREAMRFLPQTPLLARTLGVFACAEFARKGSWSEDHMDWRVVLDWLSTSSLAFRDLKMAEFNDLLAEVVGGGRREQLLDRDTWLAWALRRRSTANGPWQRAAIAVSTEIEAASLPLRGDTLYVLSWLVGFVRRHA